MIISRSLKIKLNQVLRSLPHILPVGSKILIAVSGGQDSLCLARLLIDLQTKWQWQLAIAHCDHQWRQDSTENAKHVQQLAEFWDTPYYVRTAQINLSSEAAARTWRYKMLVEIAETLGFKLIVTGHTRSDRAETFLYNLMRGSGSDGLQSLSWQRPLSENIQLVRPLLNISRTETGEFCRELDLPIWLDSTNQNLDYRRNRIRAELIPYLCEHFNPEVEKAIAQTAELLTADVAYLEQQARQNWQIETEPKINRISLQTQPQALQRRIIRQFLNHYLPHAINYKQIQTFSILITAANTTRSEPFSGDIWAQVDHPWIRLHGLDSNHQAPFRA